MTTDELQEKLRKHILYLKAEPGGERANLAGANLAGENLVCANLADANLADANLMFADLTGVGLEGADLDGANLKFTDLAGANLELTSLEGANLRHAKGIHTAGPMQSSGRMLYAVEHETCLMVQAGCKFVTLDELEQAVKENHNDPHYHDVIAYFRAIEKRIYS